MSLIRADARRLPLVDRCVQTVVTSPPYWGLRDYGTARWSGGSMECDHRHQLGGEGATSAKQNTSRGTQTIQFRATCGKCGATRTDDQIGLEPTPDAYVQTMVAVFTEVWRVLKDDGTVWLNLGSSFAGGDRTTGRNDAIRQGKQTRGGFEAGPRTTIARGGVGAYGRIQSRQPMRAHAYGNDDIGLLDSLVVDSAYSGLCDGCLDGSASHRVDTVGTDLSDARDERQPSLTSRDTEPVDYEPLSQDASLHDVPASTTQQSSPPLQGGCLHCRNCGGCLSVLRSSSRDGRLCVRRVGHMHGNTVHESGGHNSRRDVSGSAWLNYTFKPKDLVPIPWMVAMALQAAGWYLRSDVIWSKANPMPESVTDRPTKAHEYIFLLSKSERYYYDADAVAEALAVGTAKRYEYAFGLAGKNATEEYIVPFRGTKPVPTTRNKRSVWHVATQPYSGSHFATFPEALIEPCILAGSRPGDLVFDPFIGSGTTGAVADRLMRRWVGTDLSYQHLAKKRTAQRGLRLEETA